MTYAYDTLRAAGIEDVPPDVPGWIPIHSESGESCQLISISAIERISFTAPIRRGSAVRFVELKLNSGDYHTVPMALLPAEIYAFFQYAIDAPSRRKARRKREPAE